jgi:hypothetical protein
MAPIVRQLIEAVPRIEGRDFVFGGKNKNGFQRWSANKGMLDEKLLGMKPWVSVPKYQKGKTVLAVTAIGFRFWKATHMRVNSPLNLQPPSNCRASTPSPSSLAGVSFFECSYPRANS